MACRSFWELRDEIATEILDVLHRSLIEHIACTRLHVIQARRKRKQSLCWVIRNVGVRAFQYCMVGCSPMHGKGGQRLALLTLAW